MTFEQFAELCRDWTKRLPPAEARAAIRELVTIAVANPHEVNLDDLLAMVARWQPPPVPERKAEPGIPPALKRRTPRKPKKAKPAGQELRGRPSKRAQALVRAQLAHGPRRGEDVQAAEISERSLIAAADALGVRARKGQWWLPTAGPHDWTRSDSYRLSGGRKC